MFCVQRCSRPARSRGGRTPGGTRGGVGSWRLRVQQLNSSAAAEDGMCIGAPAAAAVRSTIVKYPLAPRPKHASQPARSARPAGAPDGA